jgi:nuclear GTP-binding protein
MYAENSRRAFYKQFKEVVGMSDVVLEVLDARDPLGSRCKDVEAYIRSTGINKKVVLVLNKIGMLLSRLFSRGLRKREHMNR